MPTNKHETGKRGEQIVVCTRSCPKCKRAKTLKLLPPNFKCADVICDFCGYMAQIKTANVTDVASVPSKILGAAWGPQKERMDAGIYFPLYLVLISKKQPQIFAIYYLAADLQTPEMFLARKPLSPSARRAGWQGFYYDMTAVAGSFVRLV